MTENWNVINFDDVYGGTNSDIVLRYERILYLFILITMIILSPLLIGCFYGFLVSREYENITESMLVKNYVEYISDKFNTKE